MGKTIRQFWDEMKVELGLEETPTSYEQICKMWRKRALTSEKKLATAVEALADIENSVSQFADDDDYNFIQSGNIANEALKQIGDVSEILMRQALAEIGGEDE